MFQDSLWFVFFGRKVCDVTIHYFKPSSSSSSIINHQSSCKRTSHGNNNYSNQLLTPVIRLRWVLMNYLHYPLSFVKAIAPHNLIPIDSMSSLYCLPIVVWDCLCFFDLRILHVVRCMEFGQWSLFLHVHYPNHRSLR